MKLSIWISYDLGVRGDYEGFYTWMDAKGAIECGDSFAFLKYEFSGDIIETLKEEIEKNVETNKKTRIYVIYRDVETGRIKGKFIFGKRKAAPWTGYAETQAQSEEEEE
ncbi:MAG: hypothetical protein HC919_08960 [Oscillatoriales cyanobacterium SM2_2_1]|nr:hypothetical protein [Oscillatoriales cyanobacterium SM2_2_1]